MPIQWQVGDVVYAVVDAIAAIGLWKGRRWGVLAFLIASVSQLALYVGFPYVFARTAEQHAVLRQLVGTHVIVLTIYALLRPIGRLEVRSVGYDRPQ